MKSFTTYMKEQEDVEMDQEKIELKAKIVAFFTDGEKVTPEKVEMYAKEMEIEKEELEQEIYDIIFDMVNVKDEIEDEVEVDMEEAKKKEDLETMDEE